MSSVLRLNAANTARTRPSTGDAKLSFVNVDHLGWLKCDGRGLDTRVYTLLFKVIGYTFGGSGNTFNLPNPAGRVLGSVGTVTDVNARTASYGPGNSVGELDHQLTIAEMPSHNHGVAAGGQTAGNNLTSAYTHDHGGVTGATGSAPESETVVGTVTAVVHTNAIVAGSGTHTHSIASDTHTHTLNAAGGDQYHNNIQPTLFYGNTFIFSGIPMNGSFPFQIGLNPPLI